MPDININGIKTNFIFFGQQDCSTPNVIALHGAAQSLDCWEYQYEYFKSYSRFNFFLVDLPGHGESEGTGFKTIKEYSDFIYNFSNKLDLNNIILMGHSMGGRISQVFTIEWPDKILGCVLAGTGPKIRVTKAALDAAKNDFEYFCKMATKNSFSKNAPDELKEKFYERLIQSSQETCVNDLIACDEFDVVEDIGSIKTQTIIIAGREDTLTPIKHSKYLNKNINNSKMFIIPNTGHFMMMEQPQVFNRIINEYFNFIY